METRGHVFKYPDNVDTDVIIPARYLNTADARELAQHCMEDIDKDFVKRVRPGDVIAAGWNFGCGSSRAHAPLVIKTRACGCVGCLAANCDPMTLGHRYLIEQAAARCDTLYLLVVSEDRSAVPAAHRSRIVEQSVKDLSNVAVAETGRYLISSASFPDYFLKEKRTAAVAWCGLDIAVFCRLAGMLGISRRFVGTEPLCPVTAAYNRAMASALPQAGVELVEIPRLEQDGVPVSATAVRRLIADGRWREIRPLVPRAAYDYFSREENRDLFLQRYRQSFTETDYIIDSRWEEGKWN